MNAALPQALALSLCDSSHFSQTTRHFDPSYTTTKTLSVDPKKDTPIREPPGPIPLDKEPQVHRGPREKEPPPPIGDPPKRDEALFVYSKGSPPPTMLLCESDHTERMLLENFHQEGGNRTCTSKISRSIR
jgi:hypothetical protein